MITALLLAAAALLFANPEHLKAIREAVRKKAAAATLQPRYMLAVGLVIGARQPAARDAIRVYLEEQVGTAGGPVTPEQRAKWVAALRDIGREATDAAR